MAVSRESLWNSGHDESVEVNQRALIDKVLARYSGEFTVFRELLQNSDDASSKSVEIHFETQAYIDRRKPVSEAANIEMGQSTDKLPDLKTEPVVQWTFKNNGIVFRDEDWNRLKKIAEGNPDEEKIGAFGVGFYSLFSVTDEPFVTSGDQWMGFYWKDKKDQLYARRGTLPESSQWTTFEMTLREPAPMPVAFDLTRFLSSSITFMNHLSEVSIMFDGRMLARLAKDPGNAVAVPIPHGLKTASPFGTMHVKAISTTPLYIEAEVARCVYASGTSRSQLISQAVRALKPAAAAVSSGFFSSLFSFAGPAQSPAPQRVGTPAPPPPPPEKEKDPLELNKSSVILHIFSAEIDVRLDKKMVVELQRSTKKNPPNHMRLDLIYTGKAEYDASKKEDEKFEESTGSVFQGLRADLEGSGSARIFIGHATGQTTGLGGHMAARFIPTVERESVDLVDRNVSLWNKDLLYVGGFLARAAYETEMASIRELWMASAEGGSNIVDEQIQTWLRSRCLHALKFFTFHPSTPSSVVSNLLESAFFSSATSQPFSIMSSSGVKSAADVRIPDPTFQAFLTQLPVLPDEIATGAQSMVEALRTRGLIKDITFADVLGELRTRPLSESELVACIRWWISVWAAGESVHSNLPHIRQQFIEAALLSSGTGTENEKIVPLAQIRSFVNLRSMGYILPLDGPLPEHTIPIDVSKNFQAADLASAFGWQELSVVDWTRFVVSPSTAVEGPEHDITVSAIWAESVLTALAKAWPSISKVQQLEISLLFKDKPCIPTRSGLKPPEEAYFPNAHIFPDLPVVTMPKGSQVKGNLEKVLDALGVRKHVDLQVIFNRMIKTGDWTIADLIKYLVAVQQTLTPLEMDRLRQTSAFPTEASPDETDIEKATKPRYKAGDLYEPLDVFRQLKLSVIDWGTQTKWRPYSEEAKFLFTLGLRRYPPLPTILKLASDQDESLRSAALRYFLDNTAKYQDDYDPAEVNDLAFVPTLQPDGNPTMGTPGQVFIDAEAAVFGFLVIHPSIRNDARDKLKLKQHPPTSLILLVLEKSPPQDPSVAKKWFEALASRITEFSPDQLKKLAQMLIVPAAQPLLTGKSSEKSQVQMLAPKDCYFKRDGSENLHSKLFVFVDFGAKANTFLSACGTKHEPSVEEIVQILLTDPKRFYHLSGGKESYLMEMRNIAINRRLISSGVVSRMKRSAILLGIRRIRKEKSYSKKEVMDDALDEEEWDFQYDLLRPDQVVVADDTNAFQFFGDSVFSAPQEDILESFYAELGSPRLTSLVREDYKTSAEIKDTKIAKDMRALILERLPLFLHEHTHAQPKVQYSWLNNEKNFVVRTFGKLTVTKHLNFGTTRLSRNQDASAAAKKGVYGPVELWIAGNAQVDMYEVAISLCRVLFNVPKANDALLFMTILSTDLRALRRRGYNVDRILQKQRAEREAAEKARREQAKEMEKLLSDVPPSMPQHPAPVIASSTAESLVQPLQSVPTDKPTPPSRELDERAHRPTSSIVSQLQTWKRKLGVPGKADSSKSTTEDGQSTGGLPRSISPEGPSPLPIMPGGMPGAGGTRQRPQNNVTPLSSIESNINQAIAACKEERGNVLQNRESMQMVRETLDEGYCDISGRVSDLVNVGSMSDIKMFVAKDVPDGRNIIASKHNAIARFIHVIRPLRTLYKLPPTSVNIFYDMQGDSIAFNRNASIFVNLRYYEAWHDQDVQNGDLSKAFISWFFTLAHEIAHNLVQPHNSEHEFYFSSICEAHVIHLGRLITTSSTA